MQTQHYISSLIVLALRVYAINFLNEKALSHKYGTLPFISIYEKSSYRNYVRKSSGFRDDSHIAQRSIGDTISSVGRPIFSDWNARGLFNVCKIMRENIREKGLETTPIPKRSAAVDRRHRFISEKCGRGAAMAMRRDDVLFWDNNVCVANFLFFFQAVCIISRLSMTLCAILDQLGNPQTA